MFQRSCTQKNLLDNNLSNEPSRFRTKKWVKINNESKESYSANSDIVMTMYNLIEYRDNYSKISGIL